MRSAFASGLSVAMALFGASAGAQPAAAPSQRPLTPAEVETWLESPTGGTDAQQDADEFQEAPPPPPRSQGFSVESGVGALGHFGPLRSITPVSPWFHLKLGFEPFSWLRIFLETDMVFSTTGYASPPPQPRTYRLYGGGAGLRGTLRAGERFGVYLEASLGGARVSEDVLGVYGYRDATDLHPYFGGRVGLEWYPLNPHLAVGIHGGLRTYDRGLDRDRSSERALCWVTGVALRYTF